jgi:hypothetical protein
MTKRPALRAAFRLPGRLVGPYARGLRGLLSSSGPGLPAWLLLGMPMCLFVAPLPALAGETLLATEILGRPTDGSVTVHAVAGFGADAFVEYGTAPGAYTACSDTISVPAAGAIEISVGGLAPDTRYYYRLRVRRDGVPAFEAGDRHTFHTQRRPGSAFVFDVQADSHLGIPGATARDTGTDTTLYRITLQNEAADQPDFLLDLGDTFMGEKYYADSPDSMRKSCLAHRAFFGTVGHSSPVFLVNGNHDGELGWILNGSAENTALWAVRARRLYYPTPVPGGFYSGSTREDPALALDPGIGDKRRDGYYAWEWGDALFVVLDPFWYTTTKPAPYTTDPGAGWDYTLGPDQYDWLRATLEQSRATFRFVFLHNLVGGLDKDGRGGAEAARLYEWGGADIAGDRGWESRRGWAGGPVHELLVANHVTMVLHGHDHFFCRQELDGVVYQECPQPCRPQYTDQPGSARDYGYLDGTLLGNSGHLRIAVADSAVVVSYVRAYRPGDETADRHNGDVACSYTIRSSTPAQAPGGFLLDPARPSPATGRTTIRYRLPDESHVILRIHDVRGRTVDVLADGPEYAGERAVTWDTGDLAGGIYFYTLRADSRTEPGRRFAGTGRLVLVR